MYKLTPPKQKKERVAFSFNKKKRKLDILLDEQNKVIVFDNLADAYDKLKTFFLGKEVPPDIFLMDAYRYTRNMQQLEAYITYPGLVRSIEDPTVFSGMEQVCYDANNTGGIASLPPVSHFAEIAEDPSASSALLSKIYTILQEGDTAACVSCASACVLPPAKMIRGNISERTIRNLDSDTFHCPYCACKKLIAILEVQNSIGKLNMLAHVNKLKTSLSTLDFSELNALLQETGNEFIKQRNAFTRVKAPVSIDIKKTPWMNN